MKKQLYYFVIAILLTLFWNGPAYSLKDISDAGNYELNQDTQPNDYQVDEKPESFNIFKMIKDINLW